MCNSSPECIISNSALKKMNSNGSRSENNRQKKSSCSLHDQLEISHNITTWSDGITNVPSRPNHPPHTPTGTTPVLTFYPTMEEFRDFSGYIKKIEDSGAHLSCGIAKIVPPPGWHPRPSRKDDYSDLDDYKILSPVIEKVESRGGGTFVKINNVYKKFLTVKAFRELANSSRYSPPAGLLDLKPEEIESYIFKRITNRTPIYGADTEGSLYDSGINEFNMNRLGTILDDTRQWGQIKGVNTVYLYFGMYKTCFAFHAEDMDLYSINYLHFGAPKYWFAIPQESAERFERMMMQQFPGYVPSCRAFLRHKSFIITPALLRSMNIPFGTMVQRPNEFIITFPKGYHMGFNLGYNCAESTNFATDRWIDFGKTVLLCRCSRDSVEIDMTHYMKKYRLDEYEKWHEYWYVPKPVVGNLPVRSTQRNNNRNRLLARKKPPPSSEGEQRYEVKRRLWKESLCLLFSNNAPDLREEIRRNKADSLMAPHCLVCFYFKSNNGPSHSSMPARSKRLFPFSCFTKIEEEREELLDEKLLTCSSCFVTVHPSCYGGESDQANWQCLRCRGRNETVIASISCVLCELRAGALLPANFGNDPCFVHVACAIFNRRSIFNKRVGPTYCFVQPPRKNAPRSTVIPPLTLPYVNVEGDELEVSKFQCEICENSREGLIKCSVCPDEPVDAVLAHVTCGKRAGYGFEVRDYPSVTTMVCNKHDYTTFFGDEDEGSLQPRTQVIASINEGKRVVHADVVKVQKCYHMVIDFLDGTMSENALVSDVMECSCINCDNIYHDSGSQIKVKWSDGEEYDAYYRHTYVAPEFTLRLANGDIVTCSSSEVYGPDDIIPPEIKRRCQRVA